MFWTAVPDSRDSAALGDRPPWNRPEKSKWALDGCGFSGEPEQAGMARIGDGYG